MKKENIKGIFANGFLGIFLITGLISIANGIYMFVSKPIFEPVLVSGFTFFIWWLWVVSLFFKKSTENNSIWKIGSYIGGAGAVVILIYLFIKKAPFQIFNGLVSAMFVLAGIYLVLLVIKSKKGSNNNITIDEDEKTNEI